MVPTASTLCFSVCASLLYLKTFTGRGQKINYFKMNIMEEITLLKTENAALMLNYIEKIQFIIWKFSKAEFSVPVSHGKSSSTKLDIFSALWCVYQTLFLSNIWLSSLRV